MKHKPKESIKMAVFEIWGNRSDTKEDEIYEPEHYCSEEEIEEYIEKLNMDSEKEGYE